MTRPQLSICLPVYDDHEGLLFTCEALALYQDLADCEILVVDNHPDSDDGKANRNLVEGWLTRYPKAPFRYVPVPNPVGPGCTKDRAAKEASGEAVLVIDSHILLAPGSIERLKRFYHNNPTEDLFTGPLLSNGLDVIATHFANVWRGEMWGIWSQAWACSCGWAFETREYRLDGGQTSPPPMVAYWDLVEQKQAIGVCPKCGKSLPGCHWYNHEAELRQQGFGRLGHDPDEQPFEIPAMGMGLFSCRKYAWLGFAKGVEGFGAEEWCIHGRYKKHGHKTFSLPFLRWWHRFARKSVPYPLTRYSKVRNYVLEFNDLGWDLQPIFDHFVATSLLPKNEWDHLVVDPVARVSAPGGGGCGTCGGNKAAAQAQQAGLPQPPAGADIDAIFTWATQTAKRDLDEHLPKLRELAAGQDHVTEISKRRESTVALLAARPKTFVSYQRERDPLVDVLRQAVAKPTEVFTLTLGDHDGVPAIQETDGLFIDDIHTFDRLYLQLTRLAPSVRKWIAMHDTQTYGEKGDGGGPGLLAAVRKYLRENPEWSVVYHSPAQYGLTVISRDPEAKMSLPSLPRQAWNYAKAIAKHVASGARTATEEAFSARLDVCSLCEQRTDNRCSVCGCYLDEAPDGRAGKAVWAESECPLGRWS